MTYNPAWLDAYRARYDHRYPFHITLKQPCYISEAELPTIKHKIAQFLQLTSIPTHTIIVSCNDFIIDRADGTIMLAVNDVDNTLSSLQKGLVSMAGQYKYYEAASEDWERNFHSHITIARDLPPVMLIKAESELPIGDYPKGVIKEITLVAVNKIDPEEAKNPDNLTNFGF